MGSSDTISVVQAVEFHLVQSGFCKLYGYGTALHNGFFFVYVKIFPGRIISRKFVSFLISVQQVFSPIVVDLKYSHAYIYTII